MPAPLKLLPELIDRIGAGKAENALELFASLQKPGNGGDATIVTDRFGAIAHALTEQLSQSAEPYRSLRNFARIIESVGDFRGAFYQRLLEKPENLRALGYLAGWSDFLAELVASQPGLIQIIFDLFDGPLADERIATLAEEGRRYIEDSSEIDHGLGTLHARELALIAMRDLDGLASLRVSRAMSALAETIVDLALESAVLEREEIWGRPEVNGKPCRFAVLGCGKMGSGELVYGSDLDVIFVADSGGFCTGKNDRSGEEFWARVAQRLTQLVQGNKFYEIDPRLRPWGAQGQLVVSLETLRRYWSQPRDVWERLAMTRVAPIAGDRELGQDATELIRSAALGAELPSDVRMQVAEMRARLESERSNPNNVKHGPGGYVDAEFVAQLFSLGRSPSEIPPAAAIEHTLFALSSAKAIPLEAAVELSESLRLLRHVEARIRLQNGGAGSSLPEDSEQLEALAHRCGFSGTAELAGALDEARERERRWFVELIGPLPAHAST